MLSIDNFTSMLAFAYPAYMYMTVLPVLANCQSIFCVLVEARHSLMVIHGDLWFHGVLYVSVADPGVCPGCPDTRPFV